MPEEGASTSTASVAAGGADSVSLKAQQIAAEEVAGAEEIIDPWISISKRDACIVILLSVLFWAAVASAVCAALYFSIAGMILTPVAVVLSSVFFAALTVALRSGFSWTRQDCAEIGEEWDRSAASVSSEQEAGQNTEQNIANAAPLPASGEDGALPAASSSVEGQDQHEVAATPSGTDVINGNSPPIQPIVAASATTTTFHATQSHLHTASANTSASRPSNPVSDKGLGRSGNVDRRESHAGASLRSGEAAPNTLSGDILATASFSTTPTTSTRVSSVPVTRSKIGVVHWEESSESIPSPVWLSSELSQDSSETSLPESVSVNVLPSLSDLAVPPQDGANVSGQDIFEFVLTPVDIRELETIFDVQEHKRVFDAAKGHAPDLDFLHFLKHPTVQGDSFIISNGAVFRWTSTPSKCGSQAASGPLWFAVKPHFHEGMRLLSSEEALQNPELPEEKIVLCPDGGSCRTGTRFFQRLFYPVKDEANLDRISVMKMMFDPATSQDKVSEAFARDLLSSYISFQRGLLNKMSGGKWDSEPENTAANMKMLKRFLYDTEAGRQFACDILKHEDAILGAVGGAFDNISSDSKGFLMLSANIVKEMTRDVRWGIKASVSRKTNAREDINILELYALMTPYVRHLDYSLGFKVKVTDDKKASLLSYFLWDHDFRQAVIALAMRWVCSVIPDDIDVRDGASLNDTLEMVKNVRAIDQELPVVCTAIPGLLESVFCIVQAFKAGPDALHSTFEDYYIDQMCLVPEFQELGVATRSTAHVLRSFRECGLVNKTQALDQYVHYRAVAEALVESGNTGRLKEDFLPQKISELFGNPSKLSANYDNAPEYFQGHREFFASMKTDDTKKLVAYVVATTMRRADIYSIESSDTLGLIAKLTGRVAGNFLVKR
ncbi:MAG: hypothetical protein ACTJLK_04020 [Anaplasma sp.]